MNCKSLPPGRPEHDPISLREESGLVPILHGLTRPWPVVPEHRDPGGRTAPKSALSIGLFILPFSQLLKPARWSLFTLTYPSCPGKPFAPLPLIFLVSAITREVPRPSAPSSCLGGQPLSDAPSVVHHVPRRHGASPILVCLCP